MAREFYNVVFSGHAGRDRGNTIKVMQNAIETDLVFNCFFEDDEEYVFAAGDVVSAFFFDIEDKSIQYQSIGTFTPSTGTNQFTWDRDSSDVGTPAAYSLAFSVVSGTAVPDFSIVVDYIVSSVPTGTVVPLPPGNVGVTPAEKAWLEVAVLNGDPALGFNHLGDVKIVDPSFGVGTVGFGVTAFADLVSAVAVAVDDDMIIVNGRFTSADVSLTASITIQLTAGAVLTFAGFDGILITGGGSLHIHGGVFVGVNGAIGSGTGSSIYLHDLELQGMQANVFAADLYLYNVVSDTLVRGDIGIFQAFNSHTTADILINDSANALIVGCSAAELGTNTAAANVPVYDSVFDTIHSSVTINPANHSNTINGETFPAVLPKDAGILAISAAHELASGNGGRIIEATGGAFAINCPDGLAGGFQVAISPIAGTITVTAATTLQYWDSGTLTTAIGAVTLDGGMVSIYHAGSNIWRIAGSVTE